MDDNMLFLGFVAAAAAFMFVRSLGRISGDEARQHVKDGALLLDVRTPGEFQSGHIDNALNIPVQDLAQRLEELGDRARPIVVYCRSGGRSGRAKRLLVRQGFEAVHDLGGMYRW